MDMASIKYYHIHKERGMKYWVALIIFEEVA
jgi:hypothetical protein